MGEGRDENPALRIWLVFIPNSVGVSMDHLLDLQNREHVAIDGLLRSLPITCPAWYDSLGLDAFSHWALLRPVLTTARKREAEVDAILGRMAPIVDAFGTMQPIWPPPTDYLVAVEAKCPPV